MSNSKKQADKKYTENAINQIETAAGKSTVNTEERTKSAEMLRDLQDKRTEDTFEQYKTVVEYAKDDRTILNALEKITYENNIESIKLTFEQFQNANPRRVYEAFHQIETAVSKSNVNTENRTKSATLLRGLQDKRTNDTFEQYKTVVEYAKVDKSILNALEKITSELKNSNHPDRTNPD